MKVRRPVKINPHGERGQVLILFVGIVTVFLVMAAVVVDLSLWLAERGDVQKAADLAAAAGAQDLPTDPTQATPDALKAACRIAGANGYGSGDVDAECGTSGSVVRVEFICTNQLPGNVPGICHGPPPSTACLPMTGCDGIRVRVNARKALLFSPIIDGFEESEAAQTPISSGAAAGLRWGEVSVDGVLLLDASGSMRPGALCNFAEDNPGCPMKEARDAAGSFVDLFVNQQNGQGQVGFAPYNFCYQPDYTSPLAPFNCVSRPDRVVDLTSNAATLHAAIDGTLGVAGTNLCLPLLEAQNMLSGPNAQPGSDVVRAVVLLTDGDNDRASYDPTIDYPPSACRPSQNLPHGGCQPSTSPSSGELDLDRKARDRADLLKSSGVQVYVVGFGVCKYDDAQDIADDGNTQSSSYCAGVGNTDRDNIADQRLLKCIASSPSHYFRVDSAGQLPNVFRQVAGAILGRRLLQ
jgi:hypothetical protein